MTKSRYQYVVIPANLQGCRADKGLKLLLPDSGLRHRQHLFAAKLVTMDGRILKKGSRLQAGSKLMLNPGQRPKALDSDPRVFVYKELKGLAAVYKPAGIHCELRLGQGQPTVEAMLPRLFPGQQAVLLNRLDAPTSGLVLVALSDFVRQRYNAWQEQGLVHKLYCAEVSGAWTGPLTITERIETSKRRKVLVTKRPDPDPLRWTRVKVSCQLSLRRTRLGVEIAKGRRHQIRAHLAAHGCPIVNDPVYGSATNPARLYLHHMRVSMPGFSAYVLPSWAGYGPEGRDPDKGH